MDRTMKFLITLFLLWVVLFVWVKMSEGFTTGEMNRNVYLQNDESVYVVRQDCRVWVYVYKYDSETGFYAGQWIDRVYSMFNPITIHFIGERPFHAQEVKSSTVE